MVSLATVGKRYDAFFTVIEGGTGVVRGTLSETDQNSQPSYVFSTPRHIFRSPVPTALRAGMVIRSNFGSTFIVGENGPSEIGEQVLWQSFRLFAPTGRYLWSRRSRATAPITKMETEGAPIPKGMIWAALEPLDREQADREIRQNFEQVRLITGAPVLADDLVDNRAVTKVDKQLGLSIGVLT